ncbi:uncharacterized protein pdzph1 [Cyprinodon tularosa]|uniref:uncharacterized protein pdzph1 n=1 Tax=Cyprinodon tularosa TaxID=77115 RepID=UPI0018E21CE9|nr:uncharacterized protein pdzph1 [Cyprinodon tularosa]XP_038162898.1 uncharacterized protein pdzph1 [Cyprinodon tularosa]
MSKRGRRRSSRRRKSSSSSKQSSSAFVFENQNNCVPVSYEKHATEKHEENSLQKKNVLSGFEEKNCHHVPPIEKTFKQYFNMAEFQEQRSGYSKTTEVEEKRVKIVTSVSVSDMEKPSQKVKLEQSHEGLSGNPTNSSPLKTDIFNVDYPGSHVKVEIQEILQGNPYSIKTTCVFMNENKGGEMTITRECEETQMPDLQQLPQLPNDVISHNRHHEINYTFRFCSISEQTKYQSDLRSVCLSNKAGDPRYCHCCSAKHLRDPSLLLDIDPKEKMKGTFRQDQFNQFSAPQIFAENKYNTSEDLTNDLASLRIEGTAESVSPISVQEKEYEDLAFDQFSESDNYEPMFMRPSVSTNRSSFVKDFIYCQKRKSWIRNNSIATVEHKDYLLLKKRRQTFPGTSLTPELIHKDFMLPYNKSVSSVLMCLLPFQIEKLGKNKQLDESFPTYMRRSDASSNSGQSTKALSESSEIQYTSVGIDKDMNPELHVEEIIQGALAIQVIPPSCSGSEEQILQIDPAVIANDIDDKYFTERDSDSQRSKSPVATAPADALHYNFIQNNLKGSSFRSCLQKAVVSEYLCISEETEMNVLKTHAATEIKPNPSEQPTSSASHLLVADEMNNNDGPQQRNQEDSNKAADSSLSSLKPSRENTKELPVAVGKTEKLTAYKSNSDARENLKPAPHKDRDGTDPWARKRKLFKDSRQWSSAGGSSITSDITEESVSEDTLSTNVIIQHNEDRGFYTETFQSSAWIYQGDDIGSGTLCTSLSVRTRAVSIRERTVQICKGTGEYPWGFRIQFSKPIVVTEVDTNGAAEEAGLMVGDYVLAVNGIDVTSIPHSEAANLARQGPDILTLTIGSDIARGPNTPRPPCRGYLHKRTQSGLIKGWRKRWFVLTPDCCLYYYKNKRDEGKRQPLSSVKLEGAEVGPDDSLGKPFVFRCRPQSGNRVYFLWATSSQEMKRWLEAMERAIHPITQNHVWVDVTRHNSNMPPLAMKNPDCLGLLNKMDKSKDSWIQHYCILKDACLYLYSGIRATHAHGGIYLQGYTVRGTSLWIKKVYN